MRIIAHTTIASIHTRDVKIPLATHILLEDRDNAHYYSTALHENGGSHNVITADAYYTSLIDSPHADGAKKDYFGLSQLTHDLGQVEVGTAVYYDVYLRSYLTEANTPNITVTLTNGNQAIFRLDNQAVATKTITAAANECGMYDPTYIDGTVVPSVISTNDNAHRIRIYFVPQTAGAQQAVFTVTNGSSSATITLTGTGVAAPHDFGSVEVDNLSTPYVIRNIGQACTATVDNPVFTLSAAQLNEGDDLSIGFAPTAQGNYSGIVTLTAADGVTYTYAVSGTGTPHNGVITYDQTAHNGWTFQTNENPEIPINIAVNGDLWGNHNDQPDLMNDHLIITTSDADIIAYNAADHTLTIRGINSDQSGNTTAYIYATFAATDRVTTANCTIPVTIHEVPITVTVDRANLDALLALSNVNTASYHVDLARELRDNNIVSSNYYGPSYTFNTVENSVGEIDAQGRFTGYRHEPFSFTITAGSSLTTTTATATISFTVPYGTMTFTNGANNGLWNDQNNWTPSRRAVPTDQQDVLIDNAACSLTATDGAQACHDLAITGGGLTIGSGAALRADSAVCADAANLRLAQDANNSGTFVFMTGSPRATVECYFKGTIHPEGAYHHPDWQYRGVIGTPDVITDWTDFFAYRWNEALNGSPTGCWEDYQRGPTYTFEPWKGYCMDNDYLTPRTLNYTTTLIPAQGGHEYTIVGTDNGSNNNNKGNNLITNSYSAPVYIDRIAFSFVQRQVTFYETGSHQDWEGHQSGTTQGLQKGQFVTYPSEFASLVTGNQYSAYIPAGQSFFVETWYSDSTNYVTIPASALVNSTAGPMHAPRQQAEYGVLRMLMMDGDIIADRAVMVEGTDATPGYDDGRDGSKHFAAPGIPALYVEADFGPASVSYDTAIAGRTLGFRAGQDTARYTIVFETENLDHYAELTLRDNLTGRTADILRGETMEVTGTAAGQTGRFSILGRRIISGIDNTTSTDNERNIRVADGRAVITGYDDAHATVTLVDMQGRTLMSRTTDEGTEFALPELTPGVYVLTVGTESIKFVR